MLAYITGGYGSVRLLRRYTSDRILALGSHLLLVSAALLALCVWCAPHSLALFLMGIGLYCAGWSMLQPHAQTGALAAFPESAGRISALLGFAQLTGGAVIAQLFGLLHDGTPLAAAGLIGACALMNGVLRRGLCPSPSVSALGLR
jgi:DHA1 family bicyclomycin/chloramphenicol resistance-like MFS transporter